MPRNTKLSQRAIATKIFQLVLLLTLNLDIAILKTLVPLGEIKIEQLPRHHYPNQP
ncbi:unnamed protein product [Acidithrix sp. C25]|nr:unnamed protein product [Acidithrix sp. C25]